MGIDAIVVRHSAAGAPHRVAQSIDASVVNAGDGRHEHPTQALLDAFTLRRHRGPSLDGCRVAIVGDIRNSRGRRAARCSRSPGSVRGHARRAADAAARAARRLAGHRAPTTSTTCWARSTSSYLLADPGRTASARRSFPTLREYCARYGLTVERAARMKPDTFVMHPGPMNRGIEIADRGRRLGPRSLIREQVANGVAVRMAVLWSLIGSGGQVV